MMESGDYNFSFSGLKTALIYAAKKHPEITSKENLPGLLASFQKAVVDVLVEKTVRACKENGLDVILVSGGVAANSKLRKEFVSRCSEECIKLFMPPLWLCMDNAAMVACLGYYQYLEGNISGQDLDVSSRSDV
jgi:N6-L-threonylcarbamoyladenine synthase